MDTTQTAAKYQTYPKYKPSGIDWLGVIPVGWEVKRLKFISKIETGSTPPKKDENNYNANGLPWVKPDDLSGFNIVINSKEKLSEKGKLLVPIIPKGSALVCCIGSVGKMGIAGCELATNQQINSVIFSKKILSQRFAHYALYASESDHWKFSNTVVVAILNKTNQGRISFALPPVEEQESIADFLDSETAKIGEVVGKKQKLIELLKEKRQALITHAVTKGLVPNVKMKPSGIDGSISLTTSWLGDIPEGWESWKISHLFNKIGSGTTPPSENMDYYEGGIPWVITGELRDNEIFDSENKVTKKAVQELSALKIFPKNSLLIAMYGATIGKMAILRIPATTNQACCVLGDSKLIDTDFAFYYFLSFRPHLIALSYGGGQPNISQDTIRSIKIFLPALTKQKEIVAFLDRETAQIDGVIKKVETQIEKLQEYRQALISNVVTGKVRVIQQREKI